MDENRVFTDEELKEMGARTLDLILEAIDAGDKDKAKELSNRMAQECQSLLDLYMLWCGSLMSYIYRSYGIDALEEAEMLAHGVDTKSMVEAVKKMDFRGNVEGLAFALRALLQPITIEEDDEKVCMKMEPCGSGQRLVQKGAYKEPINLATIKEPHPMTWGKPNFPIYCAHAPAMEMLSIEHLGYPASFHLIPEQVGEEPCRFCVYKDPRAIPEEVYTRVGKKKPSS